MSTWWINNVQDSFSLGSKPILSAFVSANMRTDFAVEELIHAFGPAESTSCLGKGRLPPRQEDSGASVHLYLCDRYDSFVLTTDRRKSCFLSLKARAEQTGCFVEIWRTITSGARPHIHNRRTAPLLGELTLLGTIDARTLDFTALTSLDRASAFQIA